MIRLALVTWSDAEALGAPETLLSPGELGRWLAFPSERRRRDFLAGRVAAKRALGVALADFPDIDVRSGDGRPPQVAIPGVALSIAHSGGVALAGAGPLAPAFGVDVHEPRDRPVLATVVHPDERADPHVLWPAKEAVLKARGVGLGGDPAAIVLREAGEHRLVMKGATVFYRRGEDFVITCAVLVETGDDPFCVAP